MIADQTIVSARAENPDSLGRAIRGAWMAALMGAGSVATPFAAFGMESQPIKSDPQSGAQTIALPPIPYLETIPWMKWPADAKTIKIDMLLAPNAPASGFELKPPVSARAAPAAS